MFIVILNSEDALHSSVALKKNFVELKAVAVHTRTLFWVTVASGGLPFNFSILKGLSSGSSPAS